ncbi:MAG: TIGR01777 family oxidoreductase [Acidobacteriaceae bacterium]
MSNIPRPAVLLSGGTGLIGGALKPALESSGARVVRLTRGQPAGPDEIHWDPMQRLGLISGVSLQECTAAVHLSGANVAAHRWTESYKRTIVESRVQSTRMLVELLSALRQPPRVLVVASAVGIYGERGDEVLTESSAPGSGFLAEVCKAWEQASEPAEDSGIRLVRLRFGVVLTPHGGALKKMLPIFRAGFGGKLGDGRQWTSWVSLEDAVRAIVFALEEGTVSGALNVTAPEPVTNAEFTRTLGQVLHRPTVLGVPAFALRAAFGQMAQETVLASTRAIPVALETAGFRFHHERLQSALNAML